MTVISTLGALRLTAIAAAAATLAACSTTGDVAKTAAAPAPAAAASAPATVPGAQPRPAADPAAPKPFAEVSKGAKVDDGLFPIWRKDDKVWLEVPTALLNKPFLFTINIANAVGERGLYASQMGRDWMVEFRKVGSQVQLIALNTKFRNLGKAGSPLAVEQAFSPSLLGATPVASAEHPERKSVLVDASFLLSDIVGYSTALERAYRLPYAVDAKNSVLENERAESQLSTLTAKLHFATPRIPAPPLTPPPVPVPTPPEATPDPRSMFVSFVYSFAALPETPMAPRQTDPRLGHFADSFTDLGSDVKANPRVHYVNRWRLEKKDPAAALSEPVKPITYWMDKNIPVKYRPAVEAGIVEWNKAFEKIGFKNAVVAKQQPDDATWDNMDAGHASIRWFVGADVGFAIGPSHTDPRSGEILDADIGMSDVFVRSGRAFISEETGGGKAPASVSALHLGHDHKGHEYCSYAADSTAEMDFAMDLLEARGEIAPDSPEADALVYDRIMFTIMHEVGHTLGLKHNFKASNTVTNAQLKDKAFTEANGMTSSVMDYMAYNIPLKGEAPTTIIPKTLGAYDYWAIEYAYKPIAAADEKTELARIAARSTEPLLIYADDMDAGVGGIYDGMDPLSNRFDLGDDPLAYYKKRLALSKELWARAQDRTPEAGEDPLKQRRMMLAGFNRLGQATELVSKYVGGMNANRVVPGAGGNRAAFTPTEPAKQREALNFLASGIFSADSFKFRPEFLSSLTLDYNEWERGVPTSIPASVARIQNQALDRLMGAPTANRLLDLPSYLSADKRKGAISLHEVYGTLNSSIWSELKTGAEIDRLRRNLQREHLKRLTTVLTKAPANLPPDALSLARMHATELQGQLRTAVARGGQSPETRAHLAESLGTLTEALRATMQRS